MRGRSTGDLLVLMVAATVCTVLVVGVIGLGILAVARPSEDLSRAFSAVGSVLSTLVGIVAGYLAGRTDRGREQSRADEDS